MTKRFVVFLIWAICVWGCVSAIRIEDGRESVGFVVAATGRLYLPSAALVLAFQGRVRNLIGAFGGYLFASFGRTVVPLVATAVVLRYCDDRFRFEIAVRLLIGYFGVAPVHVWATIPWKEGLVGRAESQTPSAERCESDRFKDCGQYGD